MFEQLHLGGVNRSVEHLPLIFTYIGVCVFIYRVCARYTE